MYVPEVGAAMTDCPSAKLPIATDKTEASFFSVCFMVLINSALSSGSLNYYKYIK